MFGIFAGLCFWAYVYPFVPFIERVRCSGSKMSWNAQAFLNRNGPILHHSIFLSSTPPHHRHTHPPLPTRKTAISIEMLKTSSPVHQSDHSYPSMNFPRPQPVHHSFNQSYRVVKYTYCIIYNAFISRALSSRNYFCVLRKCNAKGKLLAAYIIFTCGLCSSRWKSERSERVPMASAHGRYVFPVPESAVSA